MNRPLPHDLDAERALIGALMTNPAAIDDVTLVVKPKDLYRDESRYMFECVVDMHQRGLPLDPVTVQDELEKRGTLEKVGGYAEITRYFLYTENAGHASWYANIVRDHAKRRNQIKTAEAIVKMAYDESIPPEVTSLKGEQWLALTTPEVARTVDHVGTALEAMAEKQLQMERGEGEFFIPAALSSVEQAFGGYARGECTVFSAPTGEGKTAFGLQELLDKARRKMGAVYVSTEVYAHVLTERLVAHVGQINYAQVRKGFNPRDTDMPHSRRTLEEYQRDRDAAINYLYERPIHIMAPVMDMKARRVTRPDLSPAGIRSALRAYAEKNPLDFVVVDYLTNLELDLGQGSGHRSLIVESALRTLREMAIELGAALLVLAQLNRKAAEEREPRLHHLEQSTGIEKSADNVWLMFAPDANNDQIRTILGAKGRNVGRGKIDDIHFNGATQTFTDAYARRLEDF